MGLLAFQPLFFRDNKIDNWKRGQFRLYETFGNPNPSRELLEVTTRDRIEKFWTDNSAYP